MHPKYGRSIVEVNILVEQELIDCENRKDWNGSEDEKPL